MMENTELIKSLRWCGSEDERHEMCVDESYRCPMWNEDRITDECKAELMRAAADALEAAEQRIAELEVQLPKEGEWICDSDTGTYHCSECNATSPQEDQDGEYIDCPNYCQNCGAKMKGEHDEQIH